MRRTAYVTFDGHRTDDHKPYVFVTRDYGEDVDVDFEQPTHGNVNVMREGSKNPKSPLSRHGIQHSTCR